MAYLSAVGATRERAPLRLPAHFEVKWDICCDRNSFYTCRESRAMAIFTAGELWSETQDT
jgi:hypothetical protein